jgi:hypothetical protein
MAAFPVKTYEWSFTAAQTNAKLVDVAATDKFIVSFVKAICSNDNTVNVSVRLGLAQSALPTLTDNSLTGNPGMILSHGGIARGGGEVNSMAGAMIAMGELGDDLYLTCSAPTGGSLRIIVACYVMPNAE